MTEEIKPASHEIGESSFKENGLSSSSEKKDKSNYFGIGEKNLTLENIAQIVYLCQALSFFFGITAIVGVVINYIKLGEVKGSWLESHFVWQIRTFWIGLGIGIVGVILMFVFIGFFVLMANLVWIIYRVVKGWLLLAEKKPVDNYTALI